MKGRAWIFLIISRKGSDSSEKEGRWAKMRGENFQGWAGVMVPTFGDVLNCNQNGSKNKGSGTMFLPSVIVKVLFN